MSLCAASVNQGSKPSKARREIFEAGLRTEGMIGLNQSLQA